MNTPAEVTVWDPAVRLFHWTLVATFFIAYFTEDEWLNWHVLAGYAVGGLLLFRLLWGVIGPRYARFSDFVYPPGVTLAYLRDVFRGRAVRYLGHNPAGGVMIVLLLLVLLVTVISGLLLYGAEDGRGPLAGWLAPIGHDGAERLEEIHEVAANVALALVGVHILGVLWESLAHKENLARAMITGRKRR